VSRNREIFQEAKGDSPENPRSFALGEILSDLRHAAVSWKEEAREAIVAKATTPQNLIALQKAWATTDDVY
jgi:hypothetical protein